MISCRHASRAVVLAWLVVAEAGAAAGGAAPAAPGPPDSVADPVVPYGAPAAGEMRQPADAGPPSGWSLLSLPKPPGAAADAGVLTGDLPLPDILPPDHDTVRVAVAVGHILGADGAEEVDAAGDFAGRAVRGYGVATEGAGGVRVQNGYASVDRADGWGAEGGNLPSDIWGLANGLRWVSPPLFGGRPSVAVFVPTSASGLTHQVVDGGDEVALGSAAALGGELASDGSWLLRGRYHGDSFGLFGFDREASGILGPAQGVSGYVNLPANFSVQGGWDTSGSGPLAVTTQDAALRIPLPRWGGLTLSSTADNTFDVRLRQSEARLDLGLGSWLARAAYQAEQGSLTLAGGSRSPLGQRQWLASLSCLMGSSLRLEAMAVYRAPASGPAESWQQLAARLRLFANTGLGIVVLSPGAPVHDPLHVYVEQGLPGGFSLLAEAGHMPTFQGLGGAVEPLRFKITVRKVFDVATPPGGGEVRGQVSGGGTPVGDGVPVELGRYRTSTDADGRFVVRNVPPGTYAVGVPAASVPAAFAGAPAPQAVAVAARAGSQVNLALVPLATVSGRVYVDSRGDGSEDPAAGAIGIVVRLDDQVTATGRDGSFVFHGVNPGTHELSVDAARLPHDLVATTPSRISLGLPSGASLDGVRFRLVPRPRPFVFGEV